MGLKFPSGYQALQESGDVISSHIPILNEILNYLRPIFDYFKIWRDYFGSLILNSNYVEPDTFRENNKIRLVAVLINKRFSKIFA